jgi:hypothetical protein
VENDGRKKYFTCLLLAVRKEVLVSVSFGADYQAKPKLIAFSGIAQKNGWMP